MYRFPPTTNWREILYHHMFGWYILRSFFVHHLCYSFLTILIIFHICVMTLTCINILQFLFEHVRDRLYSSSAVAASWRRLQFVAEVTWKNIKTKTAVGLKQTIVYKKISRELYKIKCNASVCIVELSSTLKMDVLTFCENWTVFVTTPGVMSQQMTQPGSCGTVMCFNFTKYLYLVMF